MYKKATAVDRLHASKLFQKLSGDAFGSSSSKSPKPAAPATPQDIMASRVSTEQEEQRKGDTHQLDLQFAQEKHELEMQKLQLEIEKDKAEFAFKMQEMQQKSQEDSMQRQQTMQAGQAELGAMAPQPMGDMDYKANLAGMLGKQGAYEDQFIHGYSQKVPFEGKAKPMALGTGLGLLAAHLHPTSASRALVEQANALPKGDAARGLLRAKGVGANVKRLGMGAGGGLLAGLLAHEMLD